MSLGKGWGKKQKQKKCSACYTEFPSQRDVAIARHLVSRAFASAGNWALLWEFFFFFFFFFFFLPFGVAFRARHVQLSKNNGQSGNLNYCVPFVCFLFVEERF